MSDQDAQSEQKKQMNSVSLPILDDSSRAGKPRSRMGKWRAGVLIAVHVLIIAHILHWATAGSTLSPIEPSEAMETLELGDVNAGFIFFVLAIASTLLFGRFFCGWGCHVIALQDLCTWLMNKIGIRPKPFRSRLLVWAPLVFGLYMFVWPSFKRLMLFPALNGLGISQPIWMRDVAEFGGFRRDLIVVDFWSTFPPWFIAVPFLLVIGFAAVYFLGSKGFCTYGCPYGGIFGVADRIGAGKIVVSDDCKQAGHCSAVCSSNVRVAEEVRDFGMVVNTGCMKCLDCVSACPNDALRFSLVMPVIAARPLDPSAAARQKKNKRNPKRYDLNWKEEIAAAVVFVAMFFAFRDMLNMIPMLMAAGMAGIGTFTAWKLWSLLTKPSVRLQNLVLKSKGRISPVGGVACSLCVLVMIAAVWSGAVGGLRTIGHLRHQQIKVPLSIVLRSEYQPNADTLAIAKSGAAAYLLTSARSSGGFGWNLDAGEKRELAFMSLVSGDIEHAVLMLQAIIKEGKPTVDLVRNYIAVLNELGAPKADQLAALQDVTSRHDMLVGLVPDIAMLMVQCDSGSTQRAIEYWHQELSNSGYPHGMTHQAAEFFIAVGEVRGAVILIQRHDAMADASPNDLLVAARVYAKLGDKSTALQLARRASADPKLNIHDGITAAALLGALGESSLAIELAENLSADHPESIELRRTQAVLDHYVSDMTAATLRYREALEISQGDVWAQLSLAQSAVQEGLRVGNESLASVGLSILDSLAAAHPDSAILAHDYAMVLYSTGDTATGLRHLERAAILAPENVIIQDRLIKARKP